MTVYYFLAVAAGIWATIISFYGMKHESFPGKSIVPLVAITALLTFGTLGSAIVGGINERNSEEGQAEQAINDSGNGTVVGKEQVINEGQP
ncbi:MAG: hypothetical protein JHC87_04380 [Thermoleophilaceae bacterium]|nr:hypothetical protein [Thermoleophilaceae bacterium]